MSDDRKKTLWFVLALALIFLQGVYTNVRADRARAREMIDAAEIKALVSWAAERPGHR